MNALKAFGSMPLPNHVELARAWRRAAQTAAPPPENGTPARAGNSAGANSSCGRTGCNDDKAIQGQSQVTPSGLVGVESFNDLLRRSTPSELLARVRIHRKYLPDIALPAALQREIGRMWGRS